MRLTRSLSSAQINSLSLLVIYTLVISLFAPFAIKRVEAITADRLGDVSARKNALPPVKAPATVAATPQEQQSGWREGELLVRFREHAPAAKMNALLRSNSAQWNGQLRGGSGVERLRLAEGSNPEAVASIMRSSELIEFAEPNYLITADQSTSPQTASDDPRFSEQWALKSVDASQAWGKTTGSKQTVIAVIDSGIDFTHPDLINNQWDNTLERSDGKDEDGNNFNDDLHGWDFVANSAGIVDGQGHGTAVAGIIAAQGNDAAGIAGVMWHAGLMSLRVLDKTGTGDVASAVEAIDYASMNGAQVINCSWGTEHRSDALLEAVSRADKRGVVVVTSAGNNSRDIETTPHYPASYELPNLISVASTDNADQLTSFSNWGERHASIAAPGAEILTTKLGGDHQTISGTSASAPFVAGVAGLIKTLRPWLGADRTREMILSGARTVPFLKDKVTAKGIVSAAGSINALDALPPSQGLDESSGNNGGEHGAAPSGSENNRGGRTRSRAPSINPDRFRNGDEFKVTPPARTQGAPSSGLPNLDELKRKQPTNPKAVDAVPSTRCSHKDPNCAKHKDKNISSVEQPIGLIASYFDPPSIDSPLNSSRGAISDSPFSLFNRVSEREEVDSSTSRLDPASAIFSLVPLAGMLLPPTPPPPGSYSAVNDFSSTQNSGTWRYGYKTLSGSTFNAFSSNANLFGGGVDSWSQGYCCPMVTRNATGTTYTYPGAPSVVQPTDVLNLHPGSSGERGVVRWTAPSASAYIITGRFQGIDTAGTTSDVSILHNSTSVFAGNVNGYGNQSQFSVTRTVAAGDTIDFQVGYGSNNSYGSDSTGLSATISKGLKVESVTWTSTVGVTASGNNLSRLSGTGWDAGAVSTRQIGSGDGYVEFTATEANTYRMCGLSNGNSNQDYTDIDFALYTAAGGNVYVYEGGVNKAWVGSHSPGARFRISIESGVVKYWKDGALLYTSTVAPTYPLLVDTSLYSPGSTITNASIAGNFQDATQGVFWTNVVGVTASSSSLSRPSGTGWDAGAVSAQTIASGDGYVEFTASENYTYRMCGLSNGDSNQDYVEIDYAIYLVPGGYIYIYESGTNRGQVGTFSAGDRIRIAVEGGAIKYRKNGTLLGTGASSPTYPLLVDTSLYTTGATITDAVISTGGGVNSNSFSAERVDSINRTGSGGVDLLSRNANWSLPIVDLKGRAGLDLGLALSYNSLVWTKSQDSSSIKFDADQGTPSPGFRLGFPVIQPRYYNSQVGANAYLLVTPSGGHTELRQIDATTYESGDSSYLQLKDNGGTLTLRPTDGSQLTYTYLNGQYQCTQVMDRNGNFITVEYWDDGRIKTVTDTLARVITFNYDGYLNLNSITQAWGGVTHQWATFGWTNITVNTGFSNQVVGPQNGTIIPVLTQVGFADGTRYNFEYNGYAQVNMVRHYAADNHQLSYTSYVHTLPASANDCPRVTETRVWAENWNNQNNVPAEVSTQYSTAIDYSSGQATMPDGTIYKELFATTPSWKKGLQTGTEYWSGGVKKKWTTAAYTQNDTNLSYQKDPRVTETNIYDQEGNRKRTVIEYGTTGSANEQWNLPSRVIEYAANGTTEIRHTFTGYNLDPAYLSQRIIGLVSAVHISDTLIWQSIVYYNYDAGGSQLVTTPTSTIQHDAAYGTASQSRGNLTSVTRYDVTDINNASKRAVTQIGYDTNGSVVFTKDALNHQSNISYADSFEDGNNTRNTYAYPTKVTPPPAVNESEANFSSTSQYNYSLGAVTRTQGPVPDGHAQGLVQTMTYDSAGRISRIDNLVNNAYKQWVYDPAGHVSVKTKIETGGQETTSSTVFDGLGRVRGSSSENPNSQGLYSAQFTYYDQMGRAFKQSNPAEVTSSWAPYGDDSAGWIWTVQAYDWKGRPTVTTNPDGTTKEITYGGCGCAGGEVVTVKDEMGRQQRMTSDILGRAWKTEVLGWYPSQTVYSSTTNTYNALNQVTSVYDSGNSVASQTTTMTYDGHGRLKTKKIPSQTSATTYYYNSDDTVQSVTDARGAAATFSYNNRRQPTGISYTATSGIMASSPVTYGYDAAGNRTSMTDGSGSVTYHYDQLSRLSSEARTFTAPTGETAPAGSYTLSYGYNLAGGLTSITDPDGKVISYTYDKTGRTTDVTGTSFGGVTQYATNIRQRAWGAVKGLSYGNTRTLSVSYNSRLLPTHFEVPGIVSKNYEYHTDGRMRYSQDLTDNHFDRSYTYDYAGRLTEAFSGPLARGLADVTDRPYAQTYSYDSLNRLTARTSLHWSASYSSTDSYQDDRNTDWQYDADGRLTDSADTQYTYDDAGSLINTAQGDDTAAQGYDGDGQMARALKNWTVTINGSTAPMTSKTYYVRSSVLRGRVISELNDEGDKQRTFVYLGDSVLATQRVLHNNTEQVTWEHRDPGNASFRTTGATGSISGSGSGVSIAEMDPMGANVELSDPYITNSAPPEDSRALLPYPSFGNPMDMQTTYSYNGSPISAAEASEIFNRQAGGAGFTMLYFAAAESRRNIGTRERIDHYTAHGNTPASGPDDMDAGIVRVGTGDTVSFSVTTYLPIYSSWSFASINNGYVQQSSQRTVQPLPTPGGLSQLSERLIRRMAKQRQIDDAYNTARGILSGDNACSQFFQHATGTTSVGIIAALDALHSVLQPLLFINRPTLGISTTFSVPYPLATSAGVTYRVPSSSNVNTLGIFFFATAFVGDFTSNSAEGQVLQIFHELAHMIMATDGDWAIPDDAGMGLIGPYISRGNTARIARNCSTAISAALRPPPITVDIGAPPPPMR